MMCVAFGEAFARELERSVIEKSNKANVFFRHCRVVNVRWKR